MVNVLIERYIADGMLSTYIEHSRRGLQQINFSNGFISGETYQDTHNENHRILLCKWHSESDWNLWLHSAARAELMAQIVPTLEHPEKITIMK